MHVQCTTKLKKKDMKNHGRTMEYELTNKVLGQYQYII